MLFAAISLSLFMSSAVKESAAATAKAATAVPFSTNLFRIAN